MELIGKILVGLVWIWAATMLVSPPSPGATLGSWVFGVLVVVHAIECVIFLPKLRAAGGSLAAHLIQTFIFGAVHVRGVEDRAGAA